MLPSDATNIVHTPSYIDFMQAKASACCIVRVLTNGVEPRLLCWIESFRPSLEKEPLSISISEALLFIDEAIRILKEKELIHT